MMSTTTKCFQNISNLSLLFTLRMFNKNKYKNPLTSLSSERNLDVLSHDKCRKRNKIHAVITEASEKLSIQCSRKHPFIWKLFHINRFINFLLTFPYSLHPTPHPLQTLYPAIPSPHFSVPKVPRDDGVSLRLVQLVRSKVSLRC